jgi:hypothetical protein
MDIYFARESWIWSLSLIVVTIAIHATGVVMMVLVGLRIKVRVETRRRVIPILIGVIAGAGLLLAVLHGIEAAIWAAAYLWLGALDSPIDAIFYPSTPWLRAALRGWCCNGIGG